MEKIIETERLYFRRFTTKDTGRITYLFNDEEVVKYISLPHPYSEELAKEWISHQNENFKKDIVYDFAIVLKEEDRIIGSMSLVNVAKHKRGEIGYTFGREYWNKGYATEALKALIEYAFKVKKMHKVSASHYKENLASGKAMQNAGMIFEGILIDHMFAKNQFHDLVFYCKINDLDDLNWKNIEEDDIIKK